MTAPMPTTRDAAGRAVDPTVASKPELHLHLDGSVLVPTALDLARTRDVDAPRDEAGMRAALVAPARGASQADLLRSFDLPIRLLQDRDALARVAAELIEAKAADGVRYAEVRWAPSLHTAGGLSAADVIEAVCDGTDAGMRTAAAAGHPISAVLIVTAMRSADPAANRGLAEVAGAFQGRGVVGWDLAGQEITLDLCPTSNLQAGIYADLADHPLARLHRAGVSVTLSTDDLTVSDIDLSEEYRRALGRIGLSPAELWAIDRQALDVAFADDAVLSPIRAEFDAWAKEHADLIA